MPRDEPRGRVHLRRRLRGRLEAGHPWVYRTEVGEVEGDPHPGDVVTVLDERGRVLGQGMYHPHSMLAVRLLTFGEEPYREELWAERIARAKELRDSVLPGRQSYRAVFAEGDGLPGLVVDRFEDHLVVEPLAWGVEMRLDLVVGALREVYRPRGIYLRGDAPVRQREGLPLQSRLLWGQPPPQPLVFQEEGVFLAADVYQGQKTGHYFDQRLNRVRAGSLLAGAQEVLDAFCHTGGFGLQALAHGAGKVTFLDLSPAALALARLSVRENHLEGRAAFQEGNAFDELRRWEREGRTFDAIVLDPPAFARDVHALPGARRGYKEINLRAMRLVRPGGYLVTSSCSSPLSRQAFLDMLQEAAADNGQQVTLLGLYGAAPDHPVRLAQPQADYLKCAFLRVETPPVRTLARRDQRE